MQPTAASMLQDPAPELRVETHVLDRPPDPGERITERVITLQDLIDSQNICEFLTENELNTIGEQCKRDYEIDEQSCKEYLDNKAEALKLARLIREQKSFPWDGASNVKIPLILEAVYQFTARAYQDMFPDDRPAKCRINGMDQDGAKAQRAEAVGGHISYQLLERMDRWDAEQNRVLFFTSLGGNVFKKTFYDPKKDAPRSEIYLPDECIVNYKVRELKKSPRVTLKNTLYRNEIVELMRSKVFRKADIGEGDSNVEGQSHIALYDRNKPYEILEMYSFLDLDNDGYSEPYLITLHRETGTVLRIKARYDAQSVTVNEDNEVVCIVPIEYITKFGFLPNPEPSVYDVGFDYLLGGLNASCNSLINQLIDAGTLQNAGLRLYDKTLGVNGRRIELAPGLLTPVEIQPNEKLSDKFLNIPIAEPSQWLFQLLGVLMEVTKEFGQQTKVMAGQEPSSNTPAASISMLIEQGHKVYISIFKNLHNSYSDEYRIILKINQRFMNQPAEFMLYGQPMAISPEDYADPGLEIVPVSDFKNVSDLQRAWKAENLMKLISLPMVNSVEIVKYYVETLRIPDPARFLMPPEQMNKPDPALEMERQKIEQADRKLAMDERRLEAELAQMKIENAKLYAETMAKLAEAEAREVGAQNEEYKRQVLDLMDRINEQDAMLGALIRKDAANNGRQSSMGSADGGGAGAVGVSGGEPGVLPGVGSGTAPMGENGPAVPGIAGQDLGGNVAAFGGDAGAQVGSGAPTE